MLDSLISVKPYQINIEDVEEAVFIRKVTVADHEAAVKEMKDKSDDDGSVRTMLKLFLGNADNSPAIVKDEDMAKAVQIPSKIAEYIIKQGMELNGMRDSTEAIAEEEGN